MACAPVSAPTLTVQRLLLANVDARVWRVLLLLLTTRGCCAAARGCIVIARWLDAASHMGAVHARQRRPRVLHELLLLLHVSVQAAVQAVRRGAWEDAGHRAKRRADSSDS
jgi:hypothetical protein